MTKADPPPQRDTHPTLSESSAASLEPSPAAKASERAAAEASARDTSTMPESCVQSEHEHEHEHEHGEEEDDDDESANSPRTESSDSTFLSKRSSVSSSKVSLPPIEHVLKKIDAYQNERKLQDSELLLNFQERNSSLYESDDGSSTRHPSTTSTSNDSLQELSSSSSNGTAKGSSTAPQMATFNAHMDITFKPESPSTPTSGKLTKQASTDSTTTTPNGSTMSVLNIGPDLTKTSSRHLSVGSADSNSGSNSPNSNISFTNSNSSKKRTNLPRETIEILNEWVLNNLDNPYPNHTQKRILLEKTGLSNVQLSNWFINKRRRRIFSNLSGNQGQPIKKKRLIDRL